MEERAVNQEQCALGQGEKPEITSGETENQKVDHGATQGDKVVPVCALCRKIPKQGLRDGFLLKGFFICRSCEEELISGKTDDQREYQENIAKLKKILFKKRKP